MFPQLLMPHTDDTTPCQKISRWRQKFEVEVPNGIEHSGGRVKGHSMMQICATGTT